MQKLKQSEHRQSEFNQVGKTNKQTQANNHPTFVKHQSMPLRMKAKSQPKSGGFKIDKLGTLYNDPLKLTNNREAFLQVKKEQVPGPGQYDIKVFEKKKLGLIMKESFQYKLQQAIHGPPLPGPGSYNAPSVFDQNSILMKAKSTITFAPPRLKRFTEKKQSQTPGPGYYHHEDRQLLKGKYFLSTLASSSGGFLPKSKKITDMASKKQVPGPGSYQTITHLKVLQQKRKPQIEYKFVHGHPS